MSKALTERRDAIKEYVRKEIERIAALVEAAGGDALEFIGELNNHGDAVTYAFADAIEQEAEDRQDAEYGNFKGFPRSVRDTVIYSTSRGA